MWATPPSAGAMPKIAREVVLVVVERGDRGRRRARRSGTRISNFSCLLALAGGEHPPAAAEERIGGDVEARRRGRGRAAARAARSRQRVAPRRDRRRARRCGRARACGTSAAGPGRPTARGGTRTTPPGSIVTPPARQRPARGDRRVDRVAGGRDEDERRSCAGARSSPRGGSRARTARAPRASLPSNAKTAPARCGNDLR